MHEIWLFKTKEALLPEKKVFYNFYGEYTYLNEGYYESLQSELNGVNIHPTTEEALDAYIPALMIEKARLAKIPVPEFRIVTDRTKPDWLPLLGYSMNPFSRSSAVIDNSKYYNHKIKSLTLSGKYFALVQHLPQEEYRVDTIRSILGSSMTKEYQEFSKLVFRTFKIPLMKIKVIVTLDSYLLSSIESLDYDTLTLNEKKMLEEMGVWQK